MTTTDEDLELAGPESIDEIEDLDDIDVDELDDSDLDDGDLDDVVLDDDESGESALVLVDDEIETVDLVVAPAPAAKAREKEPAEAAESEADDDELQADEVEASLDVILAERLRGDASEADDVELDDEEEDDGAPNQLATVIPVRRPDEFLCQSCFLLKPPAQLADPDHQLCRDCA